MADSTQSSLPAGQQPTAASAAQPTLPAGAPRSTSTQTLTASQGNPAALGAGLFSNPENSAVVLLVLGILILFSVITWATLLIKGLQFSRFNRRNKRFVRKFWKSRELAEGITVAQHSPSALARLARIGIDVMSSSDIASHRRALAQKINRGERLERSLRRQIQAECRSLESGLAILASIGSTSPFIGLFGTVWGIMEALIRIGATGEAGLNNVAGPIGHVLIATGVGIGVAVPAVLVYNYFVRRLKLATGDMELFAEDFYSLAQETEFIAGDVPGRVPAASVAGNNLKLAGAAH